MNINDLLMYGLAVLFAGLVTFPFSAMLSKRNRWMVFIIPGVLAMVAIVFAILGLASDDWSKLGYLLIASFSALGFLGSLLSSLILLFRYR